MSPPTRPMRRRRRLRRYRRVKLFYTNCIFCPDGVLFTIKRLFPSRPRCDENEARRLEGAEIATQPRETTLHEILDALNAPDTTPPFVACALCRLTRRSVEQALRAFFAEFVN